MSYPNNPIAFPGLGLELNPNPIAFTVVGIPIHWYGIFIAVGFLVAALYALKRAPKMGIHQDNLIDAMIFATPVAIIFARLYYVVFSWSEFSGDWGKIVQIWSGGIAIYGAVIGALLTAFVYTRIKGIKFGAMMDVVAPALLIGQCIGRWGNFINREAFGAATDLPWRMVVYVDKIGATSVGERMAVHPTFLYESLWTLLGLFVLHIWTKHRKFHGEIFLLYIAWYGLGRGIIEGLRTDSLMFFGTGLRVSQFIAFLSCIAALMLLMYQRLFRDHEPEELEVTTFVKKKNLVPAEGPSEEIEEAEEVPEELEEETEKKEEDETHDAD